MKRIAETILSSMAALLGNDSAAKPSTSDIHRTNRIRSEMLRRLGPEESATYHGLRHRIEWAEDAEALWYLRSEMMTLLAENLGESEARRRMTVITELFLGVVKAANASRPKGPPSQRGR